MAVKGDVRVGEGLVVGVGEAGLHQPREVAPRVAALIRHCRTVSLLLPYKTELCYCCYY